jgi:uncharacterized protein (DUF1330 family)
VFERIQFQQKLIFRSWSNNMLPISQSRGVTRGAERSAARCSGVRVVGVEPPFSGRRGQGHALESVDGGRGVLVAQHQLELNPEKLAAYNQPAPPAVKAGGGRTLIRGGRVVAHDAGIAERTVLVEFDSFEQAVAAHESAAYQEALAALSDGVERDFRIVEGID